MPPIDDLHLREDLSRPENRINVALFGLMTQDWLRKWFLEQLDLQDDAVLYPPQNTDGGLRPDLKVMAPDGRTLAWIEVELGSDVPQADRYRRHYSEPVKTVWGRQSDGGDLSLEEVADHLTGQPHLSPQTKVNVQHLHDQILEALEGHSKSQHRVNVSDEMLRHPLIKGLRKRLGDRLLFDLGPNELPPTGYFMADTVSKGGFSLKVRRRDKSGTVALMSIMNWRSLILPSRQKLSRCLPGHRVEVRAYISLVSNMGCDVEVPSDNAKPYLSLDEVTDTVLRELDEWVSCMKPLTTHRRA